MIALVQLVGSLEQRCLIHLPLRSHPAANNNGIVIADEIMSYFPGNKASLNCGGVGRSSMLDLLSVRSGQGSILVRGYLSELPILVRIPVRPMLVATVALLNSITSVSCQQYFASRLHCDSVIP